MQNGYSSREGTNFPDVLGIPLLTVSNTDPVLNQGCPRLLILRATFQVLRNLRAVVDWKLSQNAKNDCWDLFLFFLSLT